MRLGIALIFCFFLGPLGIDKFYIGRWEWGVPIALAFALSWILIGFGLSRDSVELFWSGRIVLSAINVILLINVIALTVATFNGGNLLNLYPQPANGAFENPQTFDKIVAPIAWIGILWLTFVSYTPTLMSRRHKSKYRKN